MKRTQENILYNEPKRVALVSRNSHPNNYSLLNAHRVGKRAPNDLVELAMEIEKADSFINANACNKLKVIVDQMNFLKQSATQILMETKLHSDLHHAACNFVKVPGNIYHLYQKPSKENYLSMLSPNEWGTCPHKHLGSYRLEHDQSWTPVYDIEERDKETLLFNKILSSKSSSTNILSLESSDAMET